MVVTLDKAPEAVRPGFTCSAEITTGTRTQAVAVPIQAMAVRELVYDKAGKIVAAAEGRQEEAEQQPRTDCVGGRSSSPARRERRSKACS